MACGANRQRPESRLHLYLIPWKRIVRSPFRPAGPGDALTEPHARTKELRIVHISDARPVRLRIVDTDGELHGPLSDSHERWKLEEH